MRIASLVGACLLLGACAEFYRWPDRMDRRPDPSGPASVRDGYYTVREGDTMYSIAFRHQLDFRELAVWNDVGPGYLIRPGDELRLSPPPRTSSAIQTRPMQPIEPLPPPRTQSSSAPSRPGPVPRMVSGWRWPVNGAVIKGFGQDGNKGIDIGGSVGQPVVAAAPGKVVYSGSALKGYGELIIIKHDDVRLSAYGYNRRRLVEEGATVDAGQAIAELGVGPEQVPLLHFELRERGKPVDPIRLLPPR